MIRGNSTNKYTGYSTEVASIIEESKQSGKSAIQINSSHKGQSYSKAHVFYVSMPVNNSCSVFDPYPKI